MTLIEKYIQHNNFGKQLGMHFTIITEGEINYYLKITPDHLATPLSAHGGVISALADAALGVCALSAVYKENKVVSTVEYKINFLAPALVNDELVAHAKALRKRKTYFNCGVHNTLCVCEAKDGGGKINCKSNRNFQCLRCNKSRVLIFNHRDVADNQVFNHRDAPHSQRFARRFTEKESKAFFSSYLSNGGPL